jgi:hypothetical protein
MSRSAVVLLKAVGAVVLLTVSHYAIYHFGGRRLATQIENATIEINGQPFVSAKVYQTRFHDYIVSTQGMYLVRVANKPRIAHLSNQYSQLGSALLGPIIDDEELQVVESGTGLLKDWDAKAEWTANGLKFNDVEGSEINVKLH